MPWRTFTTLARVARASQRQRRIGSLVIMGLALSMAACGATGGGAPPTTIPTPAATAAPIHCTSWHIVPSPNGAAYPMSVLSSVSANSPTSAWAVGVTYSAGDTIGPIDSLIEQWDGTIWHVVANPGHNALNGVTVLSPNDVWAVGGPLNYGAGTGTLTLHWDGMVWSIVPSIQPPDTRFVTLMGVAASGSSDVWAVGSQNASSSQLLQPLVEHWDGVAWHIIPSPLPPSATNGSLNSVARIPGTQQFWAVGASSRYTTPALPQPLSERWDGTAWQLIPGPALPAGALGGSWSGVVALSATNAWAAGSYYINNPVDLHPLIGHWDGTKWTAVASPDAYGVLNSIAAAGMSDMRAAGSRLLGSGGNSEQVPLIERWDGAAWQMMDSPNPPGAMSGSLSIATDGAGEYWAVGASLTGANEYQTFTLRCP